MLNDILRTFHIPCLMMADGDGGGQGGKQPEAKGGKVYEKAIAPMDQVWFKGVRFKGTDKLTGKDYDFTKDLTGQQALDLLLQGERFAQNQGALNAKEARMKADMEKQLQEHLTQITQNNEERMASLLKSIVPQKPKEPALKPPTAEELRADPALAVDYFNKALADTVATMTKKIDDKAEETFEINRAIGKIEKEIANTCAAFPGLPKEWFRDVVINSKIPLDGIHKFGERTAQAFASSLKIEHLPEDQQRVIIEGYLDSNKPPGAPPTGSEIKAEDFKPDGSWDTYHEFMDKLDKAGHGNA